MEKNFKEIEARWLQYWNSNAVYSTNPNPAKKYYALEMFPYPSGDIHMGHFRNYSMGDAVVRYRTLAGFDVFHPMGFDAFGMPAEAAAIKHSIHPREWTMRNIETSKGTLKRMGLNYDWETEVITCRDDYYRWTQWLFLLLFKRGLAYRAKTTVNWCDKCQTILANEQAEGGKCWRCEGPVVEREQDNNWFFKYAEYAERLLADIGKLTGWPENIKKMQRDWIGKSVGAEVQFKIYGTDKTVSIFTTRPDTIFGVTFMAISPEHPMLAELIKGTPLEAQVKEYAERAKAKKDEERTAEGEKDGVFSGYYVVNPYNGERVPLWVADYVLAGYGTGVVMAVPAHDQRDFLFAKKYGLKIRVVIQPSKENQLETATMTSAYVEPGIMANSAEFTDISSEEAKLKIVKFAEEKGFGKGAVYFRLKDWLLSRQRYWGCPIPIIHCGACGAVPVPDDQLPVKLPENVESLIPKGRSPLDDVPDFVNTRCPQCGREAKRDVDTMDTFVDSSFYLFRYVDAKNPGEIWNVECAKKWLPVDLYIGGAEHACMHLLYFRFITKVLFDAGLLPVDEPVVRLFNQGMVADAEGLPMSKSRGNVVSPVEVLDKYGVDVSRIAMFFAAPSNQDVKWTEDGLVGAQRFMKRLNDVFEHLKLHVDKNIFDAPDFSERIAKVPELAAVWRAFNVAIKRATDSLENDLAFNTAIAKVMEFLNALNGLDSKYCIEEAGKRIWKPPSAVEGTLQLSYLLASKILNSLPVLICPFAPFTAEEMWEEVGGAPSVLKNGKWPALDKGALKEDIIEWVIQVNGKVRGRVQAAAAYGEDEVFKLAVGMDAIKKYVDGKKILRRIFVKGKLLNIVVEQ